MTAPTYVDKIWALLTPPERRAAGVLFLFMLIGMGLEVLGVGIVVPTFALLSDANYAARFPALRPLLDALGNPDHKTLVTVAMLVLVAVYAIKAVFLTFLAWFQNRLAFGIRAELSQRLFTVYMRQPYVFHLQRNSAQLINNIFGQVDQFANAILIPGMTLLIESLVLMGLTAILMAAEPLGTVIVVGVLGTLGWGFSRATRRRIADWGRTAQLHEGLRYQHLMQGLGAAKDVKLLGRESEFLERYYVHNLKTARATRLQSTLQQLPRLWLELLAVGGLAALALTMLAQGHAVAAILPTVGMFAAAAFRLLPSVGRILMAAQMLKYGLPVVENLYAESLLPLGPVEQPGSDGPRFQDRIELRGVRYAYPGGATPVLNGLSLGIRRGESIGLVGPSGAGKSTLVDVLLGLLVPDAGEIRIDGRDLRSVLRNWQDQVGYVPQSIFLTDDTLRRNVAFGVADERVDETSVRRAIRAAQLEDFVGSLPAGLDTVVGERGVRLSGGQRQRIGIARALYHDPAVLVLDEATSALDTVTESYVMDAVRALRGTKTIIIIAHRLSTVQICSRVYRLDRGLVVEDEDFVREAGSDRRRPG
jgi:ATP-binding cassette, subfamily B, bacterial PglK